jgi:hypothetical protein
MKWCDLYRKAQQGEIMSPAGKNYEKIVAFAGWLLEGSA